MQGDDAGEGELPDQNEDFELMAYIEVIRRLIQQEFARFLRQGPRDLCALPFPA